MVRRMSRRRDRQPSALAGRVTGPLAKSSDDRHRDLDRELDGNNEQNRREYGPDDLEGGREDGDGHRRTLGPRDEAAPAGHGSHFAGAGRTLAERLHDGHDPRCVRLRRSSPAAWNEEIKCTVR